jgi:hypothetical protein
MMKLLYLSMIAISFLCVSVACESQNMNDAKDFIEIEDWKNAIMKLQAEIADNPKKLQAYNLLLLSQMKLYFGDFDSSNFLNPNKSDFSNFPKLDKEGSEKIFETMKRIEKIDQNAVDVNYLFFKALYFLNEYQVKNSGYLEAEPDSIKKLMIKIDQVKNRCKDKQYLEAGNVFKICSEIKSDISDNAFAWWYSIECDKSYKKSDYLNDFSNNYKNSDLTNEIDFGFLIEQLTILVNQYKNRPSPQSAKETLERILQFSKLHPKFELDSKSIENVIIAKVIDANREKVSLTKYKYKNADILIEYLEVLSKSGLDKKIRIAALENIAEFYDQNDNKLKKIAVLKMILELKPDNNETISAYNALVDAYIDIENYTNALFYLKQLDKLSDFHKFKLWECYIELNNFDNAEKLEEDLRNSKESYVRLSFSLKYNLYRSQKVKIANLDVYRDSTQLIISGVVSNNLPYEIENVKIEGIVSDIDYNNTKIGFELIDVIYSRKQSDFKISIFYDSKPPSLFQYGAKIVSFAK